MFGSCILQIFCKGMSRPKELQLLVDGGDALLIQGNKSALQNNPISPSWQVLHKLSFTADRAQRYLCITDTLQMAGMPWVVIRPTPKMPSSQRQPSPVILAHPYMWWKQKLLSVSKPRGTNSDLTSPGFKMTSSYWRCRGRTVCHGVQWWGQKCEDFTR